MNASDSSYLRAQRQYDAQLPDSGPRMDVCPACAGEGFILGASGNEDCERCDATGEINLDAEAAERREAALEDKADRDRDESR